MVLFNSNSLLLLQTVFSVLWRRAFCLFAVIFMQLLYTLLISMFLLSFLQLIQFNIYLSPRRQSSEVLSSLCLQRQECFSILFLSSEWRMLIISLSAEYWMLNCSSSLFQQSLKRFSSSQSLECFLSPCLQNPECLSSLFQQSLECLYFSCILVCFPSPRLQNLERLSHLFMLFYNAHPPPVCVIKNVYVPETYIMYFIRRCWYGAVDFLNVLKKYIMYL